MSFRIIMTKQIAEACIDDSLIYKEFLNIVKREMEDAFNLEILSTIEYGFLTSDYEKIIGFTSKVLLNNLISHSLGEKNENTIS